MRIRAPPFDNDIESSTQDLGSRGGGGGGGGGGVRGYLKNMTGVCVPNLEPPPTHPIHIKAKPEIQTYTFIFF